MSVWLLILNARLTLAVNLPVLFIMIYVFYSSKIISGATDRSQQAKTRMNKYADTLLALFPVIRLYDAARMVLENYGRETGEWEHQTARTEKIRARLMS
jgi:ABC-type multidrug transport system fused ATPase/permease subunit